MKRLSITLVAMLLLAGISFGKSPKGKTYTGEIFDSQCAMMGSHDQGYKMTNTSSAKDCTQACVKMGGKYVLYDAAKKATYQLDDQDKAKEFAGQKAKVTGTYDSASKTIHVQTIAGGS